MKESLAVMAELTESKIELREVVSSFLLIVYDIPHTKEGDKARREFLAEAQSIGATRHSDSCYLMPWTKEAEILALQLARSGKVCVWTSETTDISKAAEITKSYDESLEPQIDELAERIDRIEEHQQHRRFKRANKMLVKTATMVANLEDVINRRGSEYLLQYFTLVKRRYASIGRK